MRYTFKLIIAGDGGVGKTTLVDRYVSGSFHDDSRITLGVQFMVKRLTVGGNPIDLQIWDFGGEERFRFILPAYCRGAHGAIFMYDITNPASLFHMDEWMLVLRSQNGKFPIVASGTKADLNYARKVEVTEAVKITGKYGISEVMEVSSKSGHNVDLLFDGICQLMIQQSHSSVPVKPRLQTFVTAPVATIGPSVLKSAATTAPEVTVSVSQENNMEFPRKSTATAPEIPPNPETWDQKV